MSARNRKIVVWERSNKLGKWCPYSAEVCKFLEENNDKGVSVVCLGDIDKELKIYSVDLKAFLQISEVTGTKSAIRRRLCDSIGVLGRGFSWQWLDDHDVWIAYNADVNDFIDSAFLQNKKSISLHREFGYPYEIIFSKMLQINKHSKRKRKIQRVENSSPYPFESSAENPSDVDHKLVEVSVKLQDIFSTDYLAQEVPGTADLLSQVNSYKRNVEGHEFSADALNEKMDTLENTADVKHMKHFEEERSVKNSCVEQSSSVPLTTAALVDGKPWTDSWPPHTPQSKMKPVPGIEPLPKLEKPKKNKRKGAVKTCPEEIVDVLEKYTEIVDLSPVMNKEMCIICCELLSDSSSYNDDKTLSKLVLCSHVFHKACIEAMFNSGNKEFIQCPSCKRIHGEKCGIQPPGEMIYHVLPYSLPGFPENDTIRIIYDIHSGIQGPEHPNPGKRYSARGFPRNCYLPDNETGRKVLRLLVKAWKRRLIFTIGQSSTTGEENTVTWNEIHHKTEFGCNRRGHGYPDPNYFSNVLAELESHGVTDDEIRVWVPV